MKIRRVVAGIIDFGIIFILCKIISWDFDISYYRIYDLFYSSVVSNNLEFLSKFMVELRFFIITTALPLLLISFLYLLILPIFYKSTFGKKVMKLKIVYFDGTPIHFKNRFFREIIFKILLLLISRGMITFMINGVLLLIFESNKTVHDYLANTKVIDLNE